LREGNEQAFASLGNNLIFATVLAHWWRRGRLLGWRGRRLLGWRRRRHRSDGAEGSIGIVELASFRNTIRIHILGARTLQERDGVWDDGSLNRFARSSNDHWLGSEHGACKDGGHWGGSESANVSVHCTGGCSRVCANNLESDKGSCDTGNVAATLVCLDTNKSAGEKVCTGFENKYYVIFIGTLVSE
jgi:hypothetical protein